MKLDEITGKLVTGLPLVDGAWPVPATGICGTCGLPFTIVTRHDRNGYPHEHIAHTHDALQTEEVRTGPYGGVEVKVDRSGNDTFHPTVQGS